ncbi:MAG: TetR/AcrR family transcriptional regulator [Pirellulales bacterium]
MKQSVKSPKLSSQERRAAILKSVQNVFAQKGFDGTTTRELSDAAGVSEALLFKHFPNKEALFSAMQESLCSEQDQVRYDRLTALEPSALTLVLMVHFLFSRLVSRSMSGDEEFANQMRLMLRSLAEDGDFSRILFRRPATRWVPKVEECVQAAVASGDMPASPLLANLRGWFVQHLAVMVSLVTIPDKPVADYGVPQEKLVEEAVWFALRGMGMPDEAIRRYYNPQALSLLGTL